MAKKITKRAQVLKFFTQQSDGLGRTRIQKLAYLADLECRKLLGRPITDFEYVWYDHGPFDKQLYAAMAELMDGELAEEVEVPVAGGHTAKLLRDTGKPAVFDFTPAEACVLEYVTREYLKMELRELLEEIVYETEPMKRVRENGKPGERLPMSIVDSVARKRLGFDLEAVIEA